MRGTIVACVAVALITGATSATAATLITGKDIRNGSITAKDIKRGSITKARLSRTIRGQLAQVGAQGGPPAVSIPGPAGAAGAPGAKGDKGDTGTPGPVLSAAHWGVIDRNTIGSPVASLRSGPAVAPLGDGSLALNVGDDDEKAAWGNEQDFAGDLVGDLTEVGFRVFTVGENIDAAAGADNMPSITFEIDPNLSSTATNYSSLVFAPDTTAPSAWSPYIDATTTGWWGLTGGAFNTPATQANCGLNGPRCTFAQVMAFLDDGGAPARILTAAIGKGRDYAFHGAVDGLRINDTVYDFEETGVAERTP